MSDSLNQSIAPHIAFNEIADNLQVPGVYVEVGPNYTNVGLLPFPARALLIGAMLGPSFNTQGVSGTVYRIYKEDQAAALFGAGSPLAEQIKYFLLAKPGVPLEAVGVAPATGYTVAAGSITFGGAAAVVGSQAIGVAGRRVVFTISPSDTAANMATNFVAAANAITDAANWPVVFATPGGSPGQVTITSRLKSVLANEYDIRKNPSSRDMTVPGVTMAITQMTGGTGTPDITSVLATIAGSWYTDIQAGWPDVTTQGLVQAELANRFNAMVGLDGHAYTCWPGTQGQIATDATGFNGQFVSPIGITNAQQPSWVIGAALAGVATRELTNDPARQLRGLALPGIIAPARGDRMYEVEQQALLVEGVSTFDVTVDGTVILQRVVTSYTTSPLGVPDAAWHDIMTPKTLTRIRWDWKNYCALVYPRAKLADDGSLAAEHDPNVVTPRRLKAAWAARCKLYEQAGWIEGSAATAAASVFERDPNNRNRVNAQLQVRIIGNLMITAVQLQFAA